MVNDCEVPAKEKRRGALALPFPGPTRLADGLELEVFYATPTGITIRPGSAWRNVGSPALGAHFTLLQLRQTTVFNAANHTPQI
jgi:hypothetical protein